MHNRRMTNATPTPDTAATPAHAAHCAHAAEAAKPLADTAHANPSATLAADTAPVTPSGRGRHARAPRSHPLLAQLAQWYPQLFGEQPLPLKRGIFQDLLDAHPDALTPDALKAALSVHTRQSAYLNAVAQGQSRHDLQGKVVEPMAPEHVYHALTEIFRRRQLRSREDLTPKLRRRIAQAWAASGMTRQDYALAMRGRNETANAVLDAAMDEAAAQAARDEALLRAFEASGQSEADFAQSYGLPLARAAQALTRARQQRA